MLIGKMTTQQANNCNFYLQLNNFCYFCSLTEEQLLTLPLKMLSPEQKDLCKRIQTARHQAKFKWERAMNVEDQERQ